MTRDNTETKLWQTIEDINRCWTQNQDFKTLEKYFHPQMVVISPTEKMRITGQQACVDAWRNFAENNQILHWNERDPKIQIFGQGKFAIVTYYFDMSFITQGQKVDFAGRDMFSLIYDNGWQVVANQFSPFPVETASPETM